MAGCLGKEGVTANEVSGSFSGNRRSSEALVSLLREDFLLPDLTIETGLVSWVALDNCASMDGQIELGVNACMGDSVPVGGRKILIESGVLTEAQAADIKPDTDKGQLFYSVIKSFMPMGMDFDVSIVVKREKDQNWFLGEGCSQLGLNTQLGDGQPFTQFNYNVAQYELHRVSEQQAA